MHFLIDSKLVLVMIEMSDIWVVVSTNIITLVASLIAQVMIGRRERSTFLKEREWDALLELVDSLSRLAIHLEDVHEKTRRKMKYHDVSLDEVVSCREALIKVQPYVYMTGDSKMIKSFVELLQLTDDMIIYEGRKMEVPNYRIYANRLDGSLFSLIGAVSRFMGNRLSFVKDD